MKGAVAGGHPLTAQAGARALAEGRKCGRRVRRGGLRSGGDREPAHRPRRGRLHARSIARATARRGSPTSSSQRPASASSASEAAQMQVVDVGFGEATTTQPFLIGPASCAVPGAVAGLEAAHRALRPPAVAGAARAGDRARARRRRADALAGAHARDCSTRSSARQPRAAHLQHAATGTRLVAGDTLRLPDLADTLEAIAQRGAAALYQRRAGAGDRGDGARRRRRAHARRPRRLPRRLAPPGAHVVPRPDGRLEPAAVVGRRADRLRARAARRGSRRGEAGSAEAIAALAEVMREQTRARGGRFTRDLHRGGLAARLLSPGELRAAQARIDRAAGRRDGAGARRRHDARLRRRRRGQRRVALDLDGLGLRRDRARHGRLSQQHARRVRPRRRPSRRARAAPHEHDGAVDRARPRTGARGSSSGSAGSARLRGAIMQIVVNVVEHGMAVAEAIAAPRVHVDEPHVHCEGGHGSGRARPARGDGLRRRSLAAAQPLLRRRSGRRGRRRRIARSRGRPAARRRRRRAPPSAGRGWSVERARRACASAGGARRRSGARRAAAGRGAEPEGWLLSDANWRSVADERRYVRSVRRHPDAALLVAEVDGELVGRLSIARDPHPSSAHVADFGLMVAAPPPATRHRHGAACRGRGMGARRRGFASSSCTCSRTTRRRSPSTRSSATCARAIACGHYRLPDGQFIDAVLMAKLL